MAAAAPSEGDHAATLRGLQLAHQMVRPLEIATHYKRFFGRDSVTDSELAAKPHVLVVGQYSTGKTTFINHLIGSKPADWDAHIGPEPTTDVFRAVCHGEPKLLMGHEACVDPTLPYQRLTQFGQGFLDKFRVAYTSSGADNHRLLETVSFVDTPGVLSGEKQRLARSYDFAAAVRWFAERADMVLLLFDANKLDISDEFKAVIEGLRGLDGKVKCVLNKATEIESTQLMRVYGALMFNVGKILQTPEVVRVYVGSFKEGQFVHHCDVIEPDEQAAQEALQTLKQRAQAAGEHKYELLEALDCLQTPATTLNRIQRHVFNHDQEELINEIQQLPGRCLGLKLEGLVRRVLNIRVHVHILITLKTRIPWVFPRSRGQDYLRHHLDQVFADVATTLQLEAGEMPPVEPYRELLICIHARDPAFFTTLPDLASVAYKLDRLMEEGLPALQAVGTKDCKDPATVLTEIENEASARQRRDEWTRYTMAGVSCVGLLIVGASIAWWLGVGNGNNRTNSSMSTMKYLDRPTASL